MDKEVNYSDEVTADIVERYVANPVRAMVEHLADEYGKSYRSVVAKLSREGVYVKAEKVAKDGSPIVRKEQLVEVIENRLGIKVPSLVKASKQDLTIMVEAIIEEAAETSVPIPELDRFFAA